MGNNDISKECDRADFLISLEQDRKYREEAKPNEEQEGVLNVLTMLEDEGLANVAKKHKNKLSIEYKNEKAVVKRHADTLRSYILSPRTDKMLLPSLHKALDAFIEYYITQPPYDKMISALHDFTEQIIIEGNKIIRESEETK